MSKKEETTHNCLDGVSSKILVSSLLTSTNLEIIFNKF